VEFPLDTAGMMEWWNIEDPPEEEWNIGYQKRMMVRF
jgi:hypothetical protein